MAEVVVEGYLTEASLTRGLREIVGADWLGGQVRVPGVRGVCDVAFRAGDRVVIVEYDGPDHYCNSLKIKADRAKDETVARAGARLVRFPYWVQLDGQTLTHFFALVARVRTTFPHGFITTKYYPASFCELGIARFERELATLPESVRRDVEESLRERAREHGAEYVVPTTLRRLLGP
jgi:hypothetical protein